MDERFRLDSRFAENGHATKPDSDNEDAELKQQLSIIDEITGSSSKSSKLKNK